MAGPAEAQSKLQEVLQRGKLIVGTGSTNPPWHFKDEKGELVGYDIDIAKVVAKGLFNDPTKIEFVTQASDARIPNITTGKVDITCQFMTVTAARAQQVAFTLPYYREGVGLLLLKRRQISPITMRSRPPGTRPRSRCCRTSMPRRWSIRRCRRQGRSVR